MGPNISLGTSFLCNLGEFACPPMLSFSCIMEIITVEHLPGRALVSINGNGGDKCALQNTMWRS